MQVGDRIPMSGVTVLEEVFTPDATEELAITHRINLEETLAPLAWSRDGKYLFSGIQGLKMYKIMSDDTLQLMQHASSMPPIVAIKYANTSNHVLVLVKYTETEQHYFLVYEHTGNEFTFLFSHYVDIPATVTCISVSFYDAYIAIGTEVPGSSLASLLLYKWNRDYTFTFLDDAQIPSCRDVAFGNSSNYIAAVYDVGIGAGVALYTITEGGVLTRLDLYALGLEVASMDPIGVGWSSDDYCIVVVARGTDAYTTYLITFSYDKNDGLTTITIGHDQVHTQPDSASIVNGLVVTLHSTQPSMTLRCINEHHALVYLTDELVDDFTFFAEGVAASPVGNYIAAAYATAGTNAGLFLVKRNGTTYATRISYRNNEYVLSTE